MGEWFEEKFEGFVDLRQRSERDMVIMEMKSKFANMGPAEREDVAKSLDLKIMFSHLTSTLINKDCAEQICDALAVVSQIAGAGHIVLQYTPEIIDCLSHEYKIVKVFAVEQILEAVSNEASLPSLLTKIDLLTKVIHAVSDDLKVAQTAMKVFKKIGETPEGVKLIYSGTLLTEMRKLVNISDLVKFRVYEIVLDIAKNNVESLEASIKSGFLKDLLENLDNEDVLVQLNVLEMLLDLAATEAGLLYLEQQGVLKKLADRVAKANEIPFSSFLIPGLMKFFGHVARLNPNEIFSKYPVVVTALFDVIATDDQTLLKVALDTFGHVASSVEGKYFLEGVGDLTYSALKKIADIIQKMPTELRICGLNNLALVLFVDKVEQDNRILSLTKKWFDSLCSEPLKTIVSLCKQPFADIRQASLEVLAVIASQEWGQEYIAKHPGLIEFLLDRNAESFKECKEAKFAVVKNLTESTADIFDAQTMDKLKQFVKEGPFYVDVVTEVAFEGST